MQKILTISIAAYNMEQYLDEALSSLIDPACIDLLDVIVVNDGSTDKTPEVAAKYVEKYPDSFRLINKENGGYGSTINCALKYARGSYIKLLDGDDWYETGHLAAYLQYLQETDFDMVFTPYSRFEGDAGRLKKVVSLPYAPYAALRREDLTDISMYFVAVRTELVRENVSITEHCFYTDVEWCFKTVLCCRSFVTLPISIYCYRLGRAGQSVSVEGYLRHIAEHAYISKLAASLFVENDCLSGLEGKVSGYLERTYLYLLKSKRTMKNVGALLTFRQFIKKKGSFSIPHMRKNIRTVLTFPFLMILPYPTIEKLFRRGHQVKAYGRKLCHRQ